MEGGKTLDEPKETQDDKTSEQAEETSKGEPETFTREEYNESVRKAQSDALAEVGRYRKAAEDAIKATKATDERIVRMLKEQDESELEAVGDNTEKLSAIREKQTRRQVESKLVTIERELEEEKAKTTEAQAMEAEHTKERNAREVASRLNVDAQTLIKFTDGSAEAMEELAKSLPKKGEAKVLKPDSSKTSGVAQMPESSGAKMTAGWDKLHPKG